MGFEEADVGQIAKTSHLAIGYLPQEVPKMSGRTVLTETLRMDGRREELLVAKQELEVLFNDAVDEKQLERYGRILEELEHLDEYRLESRAKSILGGMGFRSKDFDRPLTEFSGGWLMRVALSRILLMDPDLLLLDEPTNHLDLESLLWLEEFLQASRGAMLVISHDIAFLNRLVNEVLEIDQKRLWSYSGNLDSYAAQKAERLQILRAQYAGQQAQIAEIEAFVSRFGAKASKARQAQSKLKTLEKMDRIELPEARATVQFRFPPVPHSGKDIVIVKDAAMSFGPKVLFRDLNWLIRKGTRTAIVGVNGAGKTTLLKMLAQQLAPTAGVIRLGHEVRVGYYSQMQAETLNMQHTVLQELESVAPDLPVANVRAIGGAFLFSGDAIQKRCGVLSGGEKARVALAKLLLAPANFLVLDEPTNHLDVESRGVLLEALQDYDGTLCLVSHDRDFVTPLVDSVLEIEPSPEGSQVIHATATYTEYLTRKIREASTQLASDRGSTDAAVETRIKEPQKPRDKNQQRQLQRKKDKLEGTIAALEAQQSQLQQQMADPEIYKDGNAVKDLVIQQKLLETELAAGYARWEEIVALLDSETGS